MAVNAFNPNVVPNYIGLSGDAKPTGVTVGALFIETNTGKTFITGDGTAWAVLAYGTQVPVAASESHLGQVGGTTARILATYTRPADTTAYADGDAIANSTSAPTALTFTGVARISGGSGVILSAFLVDKAYVASQPTGFELWLFRSAAPTAINDNAAFALTQSDLANFVAVIPFTSSYAGNKTVGATGSVVWSAPNLGRGFVCASNANLFGLLKINGAFTPVSAEVYDIVLKILQD